MISVERRSPIVEVGVIRSKLWSVVGESMDIAVTPSEGVRRMSEFPSLHFHMLFLDGVYVEDGHGKLRFSPGKSAKRR